MDRKSCAARIRTALEIRGLKQTDLCSMTGIAKATISQYLQGTYDPSQVRLEIIARSLDVDEAWLMGYDVPMQRNKPTTPEGSGLSEDSLKFAEKVSRLSPEGRQKLREYMELLELKDGR